jgi:hypothetical protein
MINNIKIRTLCSLPSVKSAANSGDDLENLVAKSFTQNVFER